MGKMRMTAHNGRAGKDGAYSALHNDRNFDISKAEHIDSSRMGGNCYWSCKQGMTFEQTEQAVYEEIFGAGLRARNERYVAQRHPERVQSMQAYRENPRSCPEETILQIGREGQTIDSGLLWKIVVEHINWEQQQFSNVKLLDVALHVDEQGAPHIHERKVWVGHDKQGLPVVGQSKALAEMGIEPPHPDKPYGRYNNAKITYTSMCREHLAQVCREHGLDLELEPRDASRSGLTLLEYQRRQEAEKLQQHQEQSQELMQQIGMQQEEIALLRAQMGQIRAEKEKTEQSARKAQKALTEAQTALEGIPDKQQELELVNSKIALAEEQLQKTLELKARAAEIKKPLFHRPGDHTGTVTYNENMLDHTRKIGAESRERLEEARWREQQAIDKLQEAEAKEKAINPLYEEAARYHAQAKELQQHQERHIREKAQQLADQKFQDFLAREFGAPKEGRVRRLERYCSSLTLSDGRSVMDAFNDRERQLQRQAERSWEYSR